MSEHLVSDVALQAVDAAPRAKTKRRTSSLLFGTGLLGVSYLAYEFGGGNDWDVGSLGPIHVYFSDLVCLILGAIAVSEMLKRPRLNKIEWIVIGIAILSFVEFIRGMATIGSAAGVDFRRDALAIAGLLFYSEMASRYSVRDLISVFGLLTLISTFVVFLRVTDLLPPADFVLEHGAGSYLEYRVLPADAALWTAYCGISMLAAAVLSRRTAIKLSPDLVMGGLVLLFAFALMHRSVWLAELITIALIPLLSFRFSLIRRQTYRQFRTIALGLVGLTAVFVVYSRVLTAAIEELAKPNSTWMWRVLGWIALWEQMTPSTVLYGWGYGTGLGRWVGLAYIKATAHNLFVDEFTRLGILGLFLYVYLFWYVMRRIYWIARNSPPGNDRKFAVLLFAMLAGNLAYEMAYAMWIPVFALMGLAMGFIRVKAPDYFGMPSFSRKRKSGRRAVRRRAVTALPDAG